MSSTNPPEPAPARAPAEELVEILGPGGEVVDIVPRHRMREGGLAHRSTFVITVRARPPTVDTVPSGLSGAVDHWLAAVSWPRLGPGAATDLRPEPAPPALRPPTPVGPDTPLIVHQRADWKDVYPGYWDLAFGGVCAAGEPWLESAERELAEEAGLPTRTTATGADEHPVAVFPVAAGRYVDHRAETFGAVFLAFADREPEPADGEVVALDSVRLGDLADWVRGRPICPDSLALVVPSVSSLLEPSIPPG